MPELQHKIKATLKNLAPLRVGDGGFLRTRIDRPLEDGEAEESSPGVATVFLGKDTKPYLPGTTLKGWLRAYAEPRLPLDDCRRLFGTTEAGGVVRFLDGTHTGDPPGAAEESLGEYWSAARHTCVASHVVIDRRTRTAVRNLLFFEEFVPAGATFHLEFELRGASEIEAAQFLWLIHQFAAEDGGPAPLGSGGADGWGKVRCFDVKVRTPTGNGLRRWLGNTNENAKLPMREWGPAEIAALLANASPSAVLTREFRIPIHLKFDGPFVCNDPSRTRRKGDPEGAKGNFEPLRSGAGNQCQPYLPHSSLRGSLRSQAEKILRTRSPEEAVLSPCIRPGDEGSLPVIRSKRDLDKLDLISLLFGAAGMRSALSFRNQRVEHAGLLPDGELPQQELVGLDRFSGAVGSRKFKARYFWKPEIAVDLVIDLTAFEWAADGRSKQRGKVLILLAQALRDLAEGFVPLGFGAAKGWGRCQATIDPATGEWPPDLAEPTRAFFKDGFTPGAVPDLPPKEDTTPLPAPVTAGANEFFNPYHFHPAKPGNHQAEPTLANLNAADSAKLTLDRYHEDRHTGYLDCLLTAETPLAIGGKQTPGNNGQPTAVALFERDGNVAIPSTSLRGMVSAHFEALTKSAMRVLDNQRYSVRQGMEHGLSAIGVVLQREVGDKMTWFLKPLCLPTYDLGQRRLTTDWRKLFPAPVLKIYDGDRDQIRDNGWIANHLTWKPGDPLEGIGAAAVLSWNAHGTDLLPLVALHRKDQLRVAAERGAVTQQCIRRTLGAPAKQLPTGKKHELLIPATNIAALFAPGATLTPDLVPLPDDVVDRFERLAREMTDQYREQDGANVRPYLPAGTRPPRLPTGTKKPAPVEVQPGDLVYFDIEGSGTGVKVKQISFSSIWRQEVPKSTFDFFSQIGRDLLPMSDVRRRGSDGAPRADAKVPITPAERLFGFVEMREIPDDTKPLAALASRVSFTDGVYQGNLGPDPRSVAHKWKILSTPKPPSAALYFYKSQGRDAASQYIKKTELGSGPDQHLPKGRKFYAHHAVPPELFESPDAPWRSHKGDGDRDDKQRMMVGPVKAGARFCFRIHFENLSPEDLGLLVAALRPAPQVRYKLGLGRPLGLGTVRLDPSRTAKRVDFAARYDPANVAEQLRAHLRDLPVTVPVNLVDSAFLALTAKQYAGVEYPKVNRTAQWPVVQPADGESKLFEWFAANDSRSGSANNQPQHEPGRRAMTSLDGRDAIEALPMLDYTPPAGGDE